MSEAVDEKGVGPSSPDSPTRAPGTESRARSRSRSRSRERATPTDGGAVAANAPSAVIGQVKPGAGYLCHRCMLPGHYIRDCPSRFTPGAAGAAAAATDEARLRAVVLNVLASVTAPVRAHQQQQFSGQSGVAHEPPPPGYVCNRCHVAGHLITNCPTRGPPPGYVCHRCERPGHLVQDCPTRRAGMGAPPPNYVCNRCHVPGHLIQQCPTRAPPPGYVCHRCEQPGHLVQDCPTRTPGKGPPPPNYVCNRCQQPGHLIQQCPTRTPPPGYVCHRCNQPGHLVQDCPTKGDPRFDNSRNDLQQQQGLHLAATWPPQHHLAMWSQAQQLHQPQDYQSQHYLLQQQQQQQQQPSLYYPQL